MTWEEGGLVKQGELCANGLCSFPCENPVHRAELLRLDAKSCCWRRHHFWTDESAPIEPCDACWAAAEALGRMSRRLR